MNRHLKAQMFEGFCKLVSFAAVCVLLVLLVHIIRQGWEWVDWQFLTSYPSRKPEKAGLLSAAVGTLYVIGFTILFVVPFGVSTALYLEEYARDTRLKRALVVNIANLAGMPSIIYGLLGLMLFVRYFGLEDSILSGSLTLSLLVLPVVILSSQNSIRAVPSSIREAAYALGAKKYQVVFLQVLPGAIPGIMTGLILAISRAMGETAPLIIIGALSYVAYLPEGPMDSFTVLPVQIYSWASRPQEEFQYLAAGGIIVLLAILFTLNLIAVLIRQKYQRYKL
ncbi:MAG: phosphate ABC transporter permease PstA [Bdellovibrionales bacterium]